MIIGIDVADAQLKGNVGEAERHGHQDQAIAKMYVTSLTNPTPFSNQTHFPYLLISTLERQNFLYLLPSDAYPN